LFPQRIRCIAFLSTHSYVFCLKKERHSSRASDGSRGPNVGDSINAVPVARRRPARLESFEPWQVIAKRAERFLEQAAKLVNRRSD
jgi:hypothetical protein